MKQSKNVPFAKMLIIWKTVVYEALYTEVLYSQYKLV